MPLIADQLSTEEVAVQISDDNIYTLIYGMLQNQIDFDIDVDKSICNEVKIFREPNYSAVIALLRQKDEADASKTVGLQVTSELFVRVTVNLDGVPNFTLKVKVRAIVEDIEILTGKRTDTEFFV